jgi:hypothetical protein
MKIALPPIIFLATIAFLSACGEQTPPPEASPPPEISPPSVPLEPHWGSFNGNNSHHEAVNLGVSDVLENASDATIEDLHSQVVWLGHDPERMSEICHRKNNDPSEIWCDGNRNSPLFGVTYKLQRTVGGSKTEVSQRQRWGCSKGCNKNAPEELLYER